MHTSIKLQDASRGAVRNKSFTIYIGTVLASIILYIIYLCIRFLYYYNVLPIPWGFVHHFRNSILLFMGCCFLATVLGKLRKKPKVDGRPKRSIPWMAFTAAIIVGTTIMGTLNTIKYNGLYPFIDFGDLFNLFYNDAWISSFIEFLVNLDVIMLALYLILSIPRVLDMYKGSISRVFVSGRRIHESLMATVWLLIGVTLILVSDFFDRILGISYIIIAAFLIGKDYEDVKNLDFLKDFSKKESK
nr:hypothetical protein [Candidatus Sigynarchaeota archaeon]